MQISLVLMIINSCQTDYQLLLLSVSDGNTANFYNLIGTSGRKFIKIMESNLLVFKMQCSAGSSKFTMSDDRIQV